MMLFRRFLVLQALMLWQGGFLFYVMFVVPVGTEVLGGAFEQGRVTRHVTRSMNWLGVGALVLFGWEIVNLTTRRRRLWSAWFVMALGLACLIPIREEMLGMVDFTNARFTDRPAFYNWHRAYLWIAALQWVAGLVFAWTMLAAWRSHTDRSED